MKGKNHHQERGGARDLSAWNWTCHHDRWARWNHHWLTAPAILIATPHSLRTRPYQRPCLRLEIYETETRAWKALKKQRNHELRHPIRSKTRSAYDSTFSYIHHKSTTAVILIWKRPVNDYH